MCPSRICACWRNLTKSSRDWVGPLGAQACLKYLRYRRASLGNSCCSFICGACTPFARSYRRHRSVPSHFLRFFSWQTKCCLAANLCTAPSGMQGEGNKSCACTPPQQLDLTHQNHTRKRNGGAGGGATEKQQQPNYGGERAATDTLGNVVVPQAAFSRPSTFSAEEWQSCTSHELTLAWVLGPCWATICTAETYAERAICGSTSRTISGQVLIGSCRSAMPGLFAV